MWEEGSTLGLRKKEELHRSCTACSTILLYDRVGACIGRRKRLGFARGGHQRALVASGRHLGRLGIHRVCVCVCMCRLMMDIVTWKLVLLCCSRGRLTCLLNHGQLETVQPCIITGHLRRSLSISSSRHRHRPHQRHADITGVHTYALSLTMTLMNKWWMMRSFTACSEYSVCRQFNYWLCCVTYLCWPRLALTCLSTDDWSELSAVEWTLSVDSMLNTLHHRHKTNTYTVFRKEGTHYTGLLAYFH